MFSDMKQRWNTMVTGDLNRYKTYVLAKTALVVVILLLLWALKDKDVVVVYMKF